MASAIVHDYVKRKLGTDSNWALRALVKVYELQTADEQAVGRTQNLNGVGFSGLDSEILSSFAKQVNAGKSMSIKQMAIIFKKMPRYHNQVISFIPADKLEQMEISLKNADGK